MARSATQHLPAPAPNAIAELTCPDGRILVAGEDFDRLRSLAEALLRSGCRVEIMGLPQSSAAAPLEAADYRFLVVDAVKLSRAGLSQIQAAHAACTTTPLILVERSGASHHRVPGAHWLAATITADGQFGDNARVARGVLSLWSDVRPLSGPGDLFIDRVNHQALIRDRPLVLEPFDFRLLRILAEHRHRGCTFEELLTAASTGRGISRARATNAVRRGVQRIRNALRRGNVVLVTAPNGSFRLSCRDECRVRGASTVLDTKS